MRRAAGILGGLAVPLALGLALIPADARPPPSLRRGTDTSRKTWSNAWALSFDGVDESVVLVSSLGNANNTAFAYCAWMQLPAVGSLGLANKSGSWEWRTVAGGRMYLGILAGAGGSCLSTLAGPLLTVDVPHLACWSFLASAPTASRITLYLDGAELPTSCSDPMPATLGAGASAAKVIGLGDPGHNAGTYDEVSAWTNDMRSSMVALYNGGVPPDLAGWAHLSGWWRFGDPPDTIASITDRTGGENATTENMEAGDIAATPFPAP